ncbi:mannose-1-phosphate guanylyltransferase/mannose-6-phosphate isomerase [Falsirhodobacter sp. 20TX0035]|uniref:mannose-1-phosphate guanylyltransferase/mannose-6-phosphate isomerase n=1 Tax=Falsirhodobacter sp. 20TX0035 TaxID=3022019 RepID=UPI00232D1AF1|nr:mannose-1-phosphate guanylyltransferase/mannose-6-phosphate isomerase [Falsirhodobacter sp. 20TX0035]MDB6452510.1 mannose-1-phosphate guanylyltransferase/mannose-6-phosphate isomerase [Falsirhodobacter sp. 20TX0035]
MITPVLLCGGSGTRLWPLSRRSYPKQFAPLLGHESLFQQAALRLTGPGFAPPVIVTASDFRFIVTEQLAGVAVDPGAILIEPQARNTCAAILAAALHLPPEALLLVSPSDHALPDVEAFHGAIAQGVDAARQGRIVTFGITPDRAETGFGWLEAEGPGVSPLRRFVEKPALADAQAMLRDGRFLWNAGLFLCRADTLIAAADRHCPDILTAVRAAVQAARPDLGFLRLDAEAWAGLPDLSIDYAVMERAENLTVVPFGGAWSDMGGWDAVWQGSPRCAQGVARHGPATAIDCQDSLLRSESPGQEIVGIGLRDIVAVAMPDAVLVMDRHRAQEARLAVTALRARNAVQADTFPRAHRPWGWFETLALADRFQVKRITVHPGAALSLQSHVHRSEHWIVVSGTARVTIDGAERLVTENQSIYVPLGALHRLENPGKVPMILIEVQTGSYLAEDDITRYADSYARA